MDTHDHDLRFNHDNQPPCDVGLIVLNGTCYLICQPEQLILVNVTESGKTGETMCAPRVARNPKALKLICSVDGDSPSATIGGEIRQTRQPPKKNYIGAFCIEGKTFVDVYGCYHKIKDGVVNERDLDRWCNILETSSVPVHVTFDRNVFLMTSKISVDDWT